jgi:hypothetical protein
MRREEMGEWDILKGLDTVKAPPGFEQKVMARLSLRKREERRRRTVLRWSMAGSFASLAAAVVLLNVFVFRDRSPSSLMVQGAPYERTVSVIETLDYRTEINSRSSEPETVYLLEQVSDTNPRGIKY